MSFRQTITHMASGTQEEATNQEKKEQTLEWQHDHPHLLLICRFVCEEVRLLYVSLHERLHYAYQMSVR